jgi:ubiquinone/menaquinone biosynthesis C-methylase UbiE
MDSSAEALAYDRMDHVEVNRRFVTDFLAGGEVGRDVLDLGTGTALIPIELCQQNRWCRVMASDAAVSMLDLARYNVAVASCDDRIQLHHGDCKCLGFEDAMFDAVISNSLIHHLADPSLAIAEIIRVCKSGGRIFVRDLCRPDSMAEVENLVEMYAQGESPESQQLFRQSLVAALRVDEFQLLVGSLGFEPASVQMTSDRHWTWSAQKP